MNDIVQTLKEKFPGGNVSEYFYKDAYVYLVNDSSVGCGVWTNVYSSQGEYLGAPSGGFTGKGDLRIPDFFQTARLVRKNI